MTEQAPGGIEPNQNQNVEPRRTRRLSKDSAAAFLKKWAERAKNGPEVRGIDMTETTRAFERHGFMVLRTSEGSIENGWLTPRVDIGISDPRPDITREDELDVFREVALERGIPFEILRVWKESDDNDIHEAGLEAYDRATTKEHPKTKEYMEWERKMDAKGFEIGDLIDTFYTVFPQRWRSANFRLLATQMGTDDRWTVLSGNQEEQLFGGAERSDRKTRRVLSKRRAEMEAFTRYLTRAADRTSNKPHGGQDAENVSPPNES